MQYLTAGIVYHFWFYTMQKFHISISSVSVIYHNKMIVLRPNKYVKVWKISMTSTWQMENKI